MTVHLRLHHEARYTEARLMKPGTNKAVRSYWPSKRMWRSGTTLGRPATPMRMARIAACACDEKMRRLESTARLSDHLATKRTVTCERCLILLDQLLELDVTRKPLTERRVRAMKKATHS